MEEQISEQVEDVMDSLDSLDRVLRPLLSVPLEESLGKLTALERSKMQVLLAYVTQDLIYMYLKIKGIDTTAHPVMDEMKRIQSYMNKIKDAENPAKRSLVVDKDAAKRFINHAINAANAPNPDDLQDGGVNHEAQVGSTTMDMDASGEALSAEDPGEDEPEEEEVPIRINPKTAGAIATTKMRRPPIDPFAGYDIQ